MAKKFDYVKPMDLLFQDEGSGAGVGDFGEDAGEVGDGYAVVGHGDVGEACFLHAVHHVFAVEHAGSAVDHEVICR